MNLLDDPSRAGLLSLGLRLMSTPGKFGPALGQAGLGAMGDIQQAKAAQQVQQQRALQQRMLEMQMEQVQQEQARKSKDQQVFSQFLTPQQGPTIDGGAVRPNLDPLMMMQAGLSMDALPQAAQLNQFINPPKAKPTISKPGDIARDESGNVVWKNEDASGASDKDVALLEMLHGKGTPAFFSALNDLASKRTTHAPAPQMNNYGSPVAGVGPDGKPVFFQTSKGGGAPSIVANVRPPPEQEKPLTEGQAKAFTFASRMKAADQILAGLARKGVFTSVPGSMGNSVVGDFLTAMSSDDKQSLNQAKRDFITATLRRESGAVIGPDEFATGDRQYFPQIGESRSVIEQKAALRRRAIEGIAMDVPKNRRNELDAVAGGGSEDDPLGLR